MTEKKRIMLHIIMKNQIGGPNTAMRLIANSYLKEKYEFGFLEQTYLGGGSINWKMIFDLKRQIKEFDPDIVHLSGLQASGFRAALAARLARKKVLMTVRGSAVDSVGISTKERFLMGRIIEPLSMHWSTAIYTVCDAMKERKEIQRFRKKLRNTIHNAAPIIPREAFDQREAMRRSLGLEPGDIAAVVSGRIVVDKGIPTIIEAFRKQRGDERFSRIKLFFAGDGPAMGDIKRELAPELERGRVTLLGKRTDMLNLMAGCDVFLFATLHENLSNALLEAMACGQVVIATAVGGNVEVVEDGINGFLIPPEDPDAINESLLKLMDDETRERFSRESKRIVEESFSQRELYQLLDECYSDML